MEDGRHRLRGFGLALFRSQGGRGDDERSGNDKPSIAGACVESGARDKEKTHLVSIVGSGATMCGDIAFFTSIEIGTDAPMPARLDRLTAVTAEFDEACAANRQATTPPRRCALPLMSFGKSRLYAFCLAA